MSRRLVSIVLSLTLVMSMFFTIPTSASATEVSSASKTEVVTKNSNDPVTLNFYSYTRDYDRTDVHIGYKMDQKTTIKANRGDDIEVSIYLKADDEPYTSTLSLRYDLKEEDNIEKVFGVGGEMEVPFGNSKAEFLGKYVERRDASLLEYTGDNFPENGIKFNPVIQEKILSYWDDGDIFYDDGAFRVTDLPTWDAFGLVFSEASANYDEFQQMREEMTFTESEGGDLYCTIPFHVSEDTSLGNEQTFCAYFPEFIGYDYSTIKVNEMTMEISGSTYVEEPTEAPTEAPTVAPTEPVTEAPTPAPTEPATDDILPVENPTTDSEQITVHKGDKVHYWVEVSIPNDAIDVAGWTVDLYYDNTMLAPNADFANGYGFAAGNLAVNYALGLAETEPDLPGGSLTQGTFHKEEGRASFTDANPNGLKFKGKTTKVICIELDAIASGTTTLAYRMRDLVDKNLENTYVEKPEYQPAGGAEYDLCYRIICEHDTPIPTEPPTEAPTPAPTEPPTEAPTEPPTEAPTPAPTEPVTEAPTPAPTEPPTELTYTVAGTVNLCGENWDPTYVANDMTSIGNGMYQKVFTDVPAGDIEFKVVENHSWANSFGPEGNAPGSPNCVDTVIYDGATVTVNFDSSTGVVTWTIDYPVDPTEPPTEEPTEATIPAPTEEPTMIPPTEPTLPTPIEPPAHIYTVAGVPTLCGSGWDPTDTNNDMTYLGDGVFQKVYTGVNAGSIEFKVVEDHSWTNSFGPEGNAPGSPNCVDEVLNDNATVTVNFDSTTGIVTWTIEYVEVPTEPTLPTDAPTEVPTDVPTPPVETPTAIPHTYTVAGVETLCGSNWDPTDTNNDMTDLGDGVFQKVYTGVNAGPIEFKVVEYHSWDNSYGPEGNAPGSPNCIDEVLNDNATVTVVFDSKTGLVTWTIEYVEEPTEEPTEEGTIAPPTEPSEAPTEEGTIAPPTEPTVAPTEPSETPTVAPTEAPTSTATDPTKPTSVVNPTKPTQVATQVATKAPTSSTTTNNQSTTPGKVATGDASSVAMLLGVLMIAAGAVVSARRKVSSK